jgi:hypothetical protein
MTRSSAESEIVPNTGGWLRFARNGVAAHPLGAARTRVAFGDWLQRHFALTAPRLNAAVPAVHEALANTAEFASTGTRATLVWGDLSEPTVKGHP